MQKLSKRRATIARSVDADVLEFVKLLGVFETEAAVAAVSVRVGAVRAVSLGVRAATTHETVDAVAVARVFVANTLPTTLHVLFSPFLVSRNLNDAHLRSTYEFAR